MYIWYKKNKESLIDISFINLKKSFLPLIFACKFWPFWPFEKLKDIWKKNLQRLKSEIFETILANYYTHLYLQYPPYYRQLKKSFTYKKKKNFFAFDFEYI